MNTDYLYFYNKLIKLTTNKSLYDGYVEIDTFNDRLVFFFLHFAFFLKAFKKKENTKVLQEIYDFNFRQLELSIREIGYGDQSVNKKMKIYINLFHSIVSKINLWETYEKPNKNEVFCFFLKDSTNIDYLVRYFDDFYQELIKKTLNSYLKSVRS